MAVLALLSTLGHVRLAAAAAPSAQQQAEARSKFGEAVKLFKQGEAARALPLFEEVANVTGSPNARLYVGHCLKQLERWRDAHAAFSTAIEETLRAGDEKYEVTRKAAQAELEALEPRVAKLVVALGHAPEELAMRLDGEALDPSTLGASWVLEPGSHRLEASGRGVEPILRTIAIEPGETKTVSLSFTSSGEPEREQRLGSEGAQANRARLRTLGFVAGGVGVAGVAVWTIFGLQAKGTYDELESDCPEGCSDGAHRERIESGKSAQTIANVGLVLGAAGLAASGALLYLGFSDDESERASLSLAPGSASLRYEGRF